MDVRLLSAEEIQRLLEPDALLEALAVELSALSAGQITAPSRSELSVPDAGSLLAMPAWRPGREVTIKLVSVFHGNAARNLPGHHALICLFDSGTGEPLCIMDGTYITAMRTAGVSALATRLLAREDARVLAIVGAGVQGESHLKLVGRVRDFAEVRIASRDPGHAARLASADARARAVSSIEGAVRGADVICLCTNASEPVLRGEWLAPGAHVTSVGYHPPSGELDRATIERGRLFVETRLAFAPPPAGCGELAAIDAAHGTELGDLLRGLRPGRHSADEITVFKSMGHAAEDMAAASLVYSRAVREGVGRLVEL